MYAQIDQRTAAGLSLGGEPTAFSGNPTTTDPTTAATVDFPGVSGFDIPFHVLGIVVVSVVPHDHQHLT